METNNAALGKELIKDLIDNTENSVEMDEDAVSMDGAGEGDTVVVTKQENNGNRASGANMSIKEQSWMNKHNRASSIQVPGGTDMMGERRSTNQKLIPPSSIDHKRASTVLKGAEGTTQNDSDVY